MLYQIIRIIYALILITHIASGLIWEWKETKRAGNIAGYTGVIVWVHGIIAMYLLVKE